mgnify:CR=1 FL=1
MKTIKQECGCEIIHDIKTVDWLVKNTKVRTFDNINFTGYQRKVNENHVSNIVKYIKENPFYLPTSIICASDEIVEENTVLNIVDGQHRVEAFKKLKNTAPELYEKIKNFELSVVILQKPSEEVEVDTFITINKTSRKVDTSLAYILKNKINKKSNSSSDLTIAKKEFLAVELATNLNSDNKSLWYNKILLEGNPTKNSTETISLNSFVRSVKMLIGCLSENNIIKLDWESDEELDEIINNIKILYLKIWDAIKLKWPNLFKDEFINNSVLLGTIGVSSINKFIIIQLKQKKGKNYDIDNFISLVGNWISDINVAEESWYKGNRFSQFSSAAGFNIVANMLLDSMNNK